MKKWLIKRFWNLVYKFHPSAITDEMFIEHLTEQGVVCGKHTKFFDFTNTTLDTTRPWLLKIGDYCKITGGVIILTHDYSRSVLRRVYGEIIAEAQKTIIGDNVFIGMNSVILMGSHIGDNVIVGAGSIVHGEIPSNCVIAGNPARVICSLDEYYQKRKQRSEQEAINSATLFKEKNGRYPTIKEMESFFPLYLERDRNKLKEYGLFTKLSGDDEEEIIKAWLESEPIYESYDAFLRNCNQRSLL